MAAAGLFLLDQVQSLGGGVRSSLGASLLTGGGGSINALLMVLAVVANENGGASGLFTNENRPHQH